MLCRYEGPALTVGEGKDVGDNKRQSTVENEKGPNKETEDIP